MQRQIRQRCGFGCVICGLPLYEYEHMEGWTNTKRHVAEEITLLCDHHHREKTANLLPIADVRAADSDPFNMREGVSKPYDLHFSGCFVEIDIGGNVFTAEDSGYGTSIYPISVDGQPLVGVVLEDGHLLLNVVVFDEFNSPVLCIKNNQLYYSVSPWDIQLVGRTLTIREASRKILIEIVFEPPNKVVVRRGRFLCNGVELLVRPTNVLLTNNLTSISGVRAENVQGGIVIGHHEPNIPAMLRLDSVRRYTGDRSSALKWERECLNRPR